MLINNHLHAGHMARHILLPLRERLGVGLVLPFLFLFLLASCATPVPTPSILPAPAQMQVLEGKQWTLDGSTALVYQPGTELSAKFLKEYLQEIYGMNLIAHSSKTNKGAVVLEVDHSMKDGQYTLEITPKEGVRIAGSASGVFYGVQSLIQLLPTEAGKTMALPCVSVADQPRFAHRGMHLDVARHFFPLSFLKKCVDNIAYHKMNRFHLHLTDDQGWRMEVKKYPLLTEVGAWRKGTITGLYPGTGYDSTRHGGFYTQAQLRELVEYARQRYIEVIPEIDMPGHMIAALTAYPQLGCTGGPYEVSQIWGISDDVLCAGNDSVYIFLQDVLDEVAEVFPSALVHLGGDECPKVRWEACPKCQARMKCEGLKTGEELQAYLVNRMAAHLTTKGRTMIGWDEITDGGTIPTNVVVMSWRGDGEHGLRATRQGHQVIMTPSYGFYMDYPQTSKEDSLAADWGGVTSVRKVYTREPIPDTLSPQYAHYVLGGQVNTWTEYMNNTSKVEYMVFPRMSAASEVFWSAPAQRNWEAYKQRMQAQYKRYKLWGVNYNPADLDEE